MLKHSKLQTFYITARGYPQYTLHLLLTMNGNINSHHGNIINQHTTLSAPTIGVDVFKELINGIKSDINDMNNGINTNLANFNSKLDGITTCIHLHEMKINDLGQRMESLEKNRTYSDIAKLPP